VKPKKMKAKAKLAKRSSQVALTSLLLIILSLILNVSPASAHKSMAYERGGNIHANLSLTLNWMSGLNNGTSIHKL